ncbi:hypothetical protein KIH86_23565 [Paenibacillus sp. HN-1]|uniref:hypothetical protein n=1 Tax=Paenibacillus TaxID=44249 RepID=UPI001CA8F8B8|nr:MULTISPECIES: hypothetical protein [Paenibacillus]MBY9081131.1 hypothetical protein [Paenibacillus sp. CGMCC 1.18879]MBY9087168.1 hypothetical protein [Paenibacillus sinensis]
MPIMRRAAMTVLAGVLLLLSACGNTPETTGEGQASPSSGPTPVSAGPEISPGWTGEGTPPPGSSEPPASPGAGESSSSEDMEGQPPTSLEAASVVMKALAAGDMRALAAWVHPDKGLRFSPYGYVDVKTDLVFSRSEVEGLMHNPAPQIWGTHAGSGEPIELAFPDYYKKFVYDTDFSAGATIAVNRAIGKGTTVNNVNEVYPAASHDYVEYHVDGVDPAAEGMDWRSLRLVFEKIGDDRALVGIIHDQWTP